MTYRQSKFGPYRQWFLLLQDEYQLLNKGHDSLILNSTNKCGKAHLIDYVSDGVLFIYAKWLQGTQLVA